MGASAVHLADMASPRLHEVVVSNTKVSGLPHRIADSPGSSAGWRLLVRLQGHLHTLENSFTFMFLAFIIQSKYLLKSNPLLQCGR